MYRFGFGLAAIALTLPLMIFIGTATRLAAARREERYAAMRLVGSTARQTNAVASVDVASARWSGTLIGVGAFVALHPVVAAVPVTGTRFFAHDVTPTAPATPWSRSAYRWRPWRPRSGRCGGCGSRRSASAGGRRRRRRRRGGCSRCSRVSVLFVGGVAANRDGAVGRRSSPGPGAGHARAGDRGALAHHEVARLLARLAEDRPALLAGAG